MSARRARGASNGQSLVEFALVIPLFLAMLFGMIDLGRVVWARNALSSAAREAARFAIVHGGSASNTCPVGPAGPDALIPPASPACPFPSPSKQAIVDTALAYAVAAGHNVTVDVCYGNGCSGSTDTAGATNVRGTPVTVRVRGNVPFLTGALLGNPVYNLDGAATMLVNH